MPSVDHAVVAAAGFGSRLGRGHPKCLVEFRGRTLLERQLELLEDVPDVRVVVGFQEAAVTDLARSLRPDVIIVRNPAYASTTTLDSYARGARHLSDPCLFLDADILFEPPSFQAFLRAAAARHDGALVGYTHTRTRDAVHVVVQGQQITSFSRSVRTPFEWANLALLPPGFCETGSGAVFERMAQELPLAGALVDSFEIDCEEDLELAEKEYQGSPLLPSARGRRPSVLAAG